MLWLFRNRERAPRVRARAARRFSQNLPSRQQKPATRADGMRHSALWDVIFNDISILTRWQMILFQAFSFITPAASFMIALCRCSYLLAKRCEFFWQNTSMLFIMPGLRITGAVPPRNRRPKISGYRVLTSGFYRAVDKVKIYSRQMNVMNVNARDMSNLLLISFHYRAIRYDVIADSRAFFYAE